MANPYQDPQQDGTYDDQSASPQAPTAASKKKRAYAGQAYEFGAGGNAALGGQQAQGGQPPAAAGYGAPAAAAYGATPAAGMYGGGGAGAPAYGYPQAPQVPEQATPYGQPAYGQPQGGYEAPQQQQQGGVAGVTQQFGQMGVGGTPQPQQVPGVPAQRLNPLVPVDISMQGAPFHVSDLDQPPPPIILPPNVSTLLLG